MSIYEPAKVGIEASVRCAVAAFRRGDVDLAQRSLIASAYHRHSQKRTLPQEISLLWCLAWFAFSEGRSDKAEQFVKEIIEIYYRTQNPCPKRLSHTYFVLSLFCDVQGKTLESQGNKRKAFDLIGEEHGQFMLSYELIRTSPPRLSA